MCIAVFRDLPVEFKQPLNAECPGADAILLGGTYHSCDGIALIATELRGTHQGPMDAAPLSFKEL